MMKKIPFFFLLILFSVAVSGEALNSMVQGEEIHPLKLRTSHHPAFFRIVLEGSEFLISRGMVNQKGKDIIVRFPYVSFRIQEGKAQVIYKTYKDIILFSPGDFNKFKVSYFDNPNRLVIDVYLDTWSEQITPFIEGTEESREIRRIKTIVIDPGHGGYEHGIVKESSREKNVVLDIAKRLRALMNRDYTRCFLVRKSDRFMSLGERVKFTNSRNAEVFLSLHVGKHGEIVLYTPVIDESVSNELKTYWVNKGQESYIYKTSALSNAIQQTITESFGEDMVSIKPLPYSILSKIEAAALIIELPSFNDADYVSEFKTELAQTIFKGINLYEESTAD